MDITLHFYKGFLKEVSMIYVAEIHKVKVTQVRGSSTTLRPSIKAKQPGLIL